jgi:hypothetical protein
MFDSIAKILPLFLFYLFFAFPDDFLYTSISPLGRFIAISLILFYSLISTYSGLIMCFAVIVYYNLHSVEKTSQFESVMLVGNNMFQSVITENFEDDTDNEEKNREFRQNNCENGQVKYKKNNVHNENCEHIYPDLEFTESSCNPCDKSCGFTIREQLKIEEDIVYPKTDDNWVNTIWNTWFSDTTPPAFNRTQFTLL